MSFFAAPRPQPIPNNTPPFGGSAYLVDNISFGGGSNFGSSIDVSPAPRAIGPFGSYTPPSSVSDKRGFNKTPDSVKLNFFAKFERYVPARSSRPQRTEINHYNRTVFSTHQNTRTSPSNALKQHSTLTSVSSPSILLSSPPQPPKGSQKPKPIRFRYRITPQRQCGDFSNGPTPAITHLPCRRSSVTPTTRGVRSTRKCISSLIISESMS